MKKIIIMIGIGVLISGILFFLTLNDSTNPIQKTRHFWGGDTLSKKEVCQKWGEEDSFDLKKFKESEDNEFIRAKMTCSLLKNQTDYYGIDIQKIKELFGAYSGYYFTDSIPTYVIQTAQTRDQEMWQIVFLPDKEYKVRKIIVHKKCCYN